MNWEFYVGVPGLQIGRIIDVCKRLRQVIERAPQIVHGIPDQQRDSFWQRRIEPNNPSELVGRYSVPNPPQTAWIGRPDGPLFDDGIQLI